VNSTTPKRLRIAVLNQVFAATAGGAERYSMALVEQLAQRHEIHVFAQRIEHQWPGVTYHRVTKPLIRPRWMNQLWFAVATWWATRSGFDVVHSHENTWHGQVQTVHVLPLKYALFHGRTGWSLLLRCVKVATSLRLLVYLWLEHARFANPDRRCIVVTSNSLMTKVAKAYPATTRSLCLVTPGVTTASASATSAQQLAARGRLGLPNDGFGVLFVAHDYRKKGLDTLITALRQLPENCWLVVVGNTMQIRAFQALAKTSGVDRRVFFLGVLKEVNDAYFAANCLAHPTLEDTFAMVVLEAMAHGLPVLVSSERHCGIAGLLSHEVNALILENPRDSKELANALHRVLQEPALYQRLRAEALVFANLHQWPVIAMQQEAIYFSLLKAPV